MKLRVSIVGMILILFLFTPQPAQASTLRNARKIWKEKVITPITSPLVRAIQTPLKWKELSTQEKTTKLTKAKEKIGNTTRVAYKVLEKFERRPRYQTTATMLRLDLEDGMDQVQNSTTPEEFEVAVKQLQEIWAHGKEELRSQL